MEKLKELKLRTRIWNTQEGYYALYQDIMGSEPTICDIEDTINHCLASLVDWVYLKRHKNKINGSNSASCAEMPVICIPYSYCIKLRYGLDGYGVKSYSEIANRINTEGVWRNYIKLGDIAIARGVQKECTQGIVRKWIDRAIMLLQHPNYMEILQKGLASYITSQLIPSTINEEQTNVIISEVLNYNSDADRAICKYHNKVIQRKEEEAARKRKEKEFKETLRELRTRHEQAVGMGFATRGLW